jgi:hypothetical protein
MNPVSSFSLLGASNTRHELPKRDGMNRFASAPPEGGSFLLWVAACSAAFLTGLVAVGTAELFVGENEILMPAVNGGSGLPV